MKDRQNNKLLDLNKVKISKARDLSTLSIHSKSWDKLLYDSAQQQPISSYSWLSSYFKYHIEDQDEWLCILAYNESELIGVLPLIVTEKYHLLNKTIILRTPSDDHTIGADIVAVRGYENEVIPLLIRAALEEFPRACIELHFIPETSPTIQVLKQSFNDYILLSEDVGKASYIPIEGSFDQYLKGLSKNFRHNLKKAEKKLSGLKDVLFEIEDNDDSVVSNLDRFVDVEGSGWKGRCGTAINLSPNLFDFYNSLVRGLSSSGWIEWHFLSASGKTIAGLLAVKFNRQLALLKIGYDENYLMCSPGNMLMKAVIEKAFDTKYIDEVNLMTDMAWLSNWNAEKKTYHTIRMYPRCIAPLLSDYVQRRVRKQLMSMPRLYGLLRRVYRLTRKQKPL